MLFGCFFKSKVCHDDRMISCVFEGEILLEVEIGEVEGAGFFAGGKDRDHAGEFRRGRLKEWQQLVGETEATVVVGCQFPVQAFRGF